MELDKLSREIGPSIDSVKMPAVDFLNRQKEREGYQIITEKTVIQYKE